MIDLQTIIEPQIHHIVARANGLSVSYQQFENYHLHKHIAMDALLHPDCLHPITIRLKQIKAGRRKLQPKKPFIPDLDLAAGMPFSNEMIEFDAQFVYNQCHELLGFTGVKHLKFQYHQYRIIKNTHTGQPQVIVKHPLPQAEGLAIGVLAQYNCMLGYMYHGVYTVPAMEDSAEHFAYLDAGDYLADLRDYPRSAFLLQLMHNAPKGYRARFDAKRQMVYFNGKKWPNKSQNNRQYELALHQRFNDVELFNMLKTDDLYHNYQAALFIDDFRRICQFPNDPVEVAIHTMPDRDFNKQKEWGFK